MGSCQLRLPVPVLVPAVAAGRCRSWGFLGRGLGFCSTICVHQKSVRFGSPVSVLSSPMEAAAVAGSDGSGMKLLFVEMGVGYDQHGQDITRACKDAISSNSIPAFRQGSIPGVSTDQMKLQIKLGVPRSTQQFLDIEMVKTVFPYGKILNVEVVDGGLICSSGVCLEAMGDMNDDCYVVNAAVYVGY